MIKGFVNFSSTPAHPVWINPQTSAAAEFRRLHKNVVEGLGNSTTRPEQTVFFYRGPL